MESDTDERHWTPWTFLLAAILAAVHHKDLLSCAAATYAPVCPCVVSQAAWHHQKRGAVLADVGISYKKVVMEGQLWRIVTASLVHLDVSVARVPDHGCSKPCLLLAT